MKTKIKEDKMYTKLDIKRRIAILLWMLLICSVMFGIYKNFTAIDIHTIKEIKVIEEKLVDTNKIESFVKNFAKEFYTWENNRKSIEGRMTNIEKYMTRELIELNIDTIRSDIPTSSIAKEVQIWEVKKSTEQEYNVTYSVDQEIKEGKSNKKITSFFMLQVHMDKERNLIIIKNPTVSSSIQKSSYVPETKENDSEIDAVTMDEINDFLKTFFTLYPNANEKELAYYVKDNALEQINRDYVFSEIINPVYTMNGKNIGVSVSLKYIDKQTKTEQISQFDLVLNKGDNWMIIE